MPVPDSSRVAATVDLLRPFTGEWALVAAYRLLRVELGRQRGVTVTADPVLEAHLGPYPRARALEQLTADGPAGDDVRALAELHQRLLHPDRRKAAGAWFTPQPLVDHLLDEALEPTLDEVPTPSDVTLLDPACGSGLFLVAALHRLLRRGVPIEHALGHCLHGTEVDPAAAELARLSLWVAAGDAGGGPDLPEPQIEVGDGLERDPAAYDVVIGNPPFLNRLERRTAIDAAAGRRLTHVSEGVVGPYTDLSAVFLHHAVSWTRPGGRVALVQPQSLLAVRDAAGVRRHLAVTCSLESLWASSEPVFDAGVLTCAPVLRKGGLQAGVRRRHGPSFEPRPAVEPGELDGTWSHLVAEALGVPQVWSRRARPTRSVGDVADCTADFRDQYYGLDGHVHEAVDCAAGVPLVTTGLIDPAVTHWGRRPTRFLKQAWTAPVVDLRSLAGDPGLARWSRARLVPKVLVGTQGQVVEAVADAAGGWLPSVPVVTVVPRDVSLWRLLAVLLAPPVAAHAATTYTGAGLTMRAIKLSARQVAQLPLPAGQAAWGEAACRAEQAQREPEHRLAHLEAMGRLMCQAYDVPPDEVLPWWLARLR